MNIFLVSSCPDPDQRHLRFIPYRHPTQWEEGLKPEDRLDLILEGIVNGHAGFKRRIEDRIGNDYKVPISPSGLFITQSMNILDTIKNQLGHVKDTIVKLFDEKIQDIKELIEEPVEQIRNVYNFLLDEENDNE